MYAVTDTHTLVWYLADDSRLSSKVHAVLHSAEKGEATIIVPAVVFLECLDIFEKERVHFDFQGLILKVSQSRNFVIAELNWSLILEVERTKGFKDLHDRVIVATAKLFDAPLLSRDKLIHRLYAKTVW